MRGFAANALVAIVGLVATNVRKIRSFYRNNMPLPSKPKIKPIGARPRPRRHTPGRRPTYRWSPTVSLNNRHVRTALRCAQKAPQRPSGAPQNASGATDRAHGCRFGRPEVSIGEAPEPSGSFATVVARFRT